jgi:CubicO group peptidase (beta-lactamase class C family)
MKFTSLILSSLALLLLSASCRPQATHQPVAAPAEPTGFSASQLDTLSAFLAKAGSSSLLLMAEGQPVYAWGKTDKRHTIHSIRKTILNALYGIKVAEGVIDTSMTIGQLALDDIAPALSEQEKGARIADLLKSRSGIYHNAAAVSEGMLEGKPERDHYKPGEHYYYNNWDFNVLGAILEQQTGKTLYQLFLEEIALPLGMQDYSGSWAEIDGEDAGAVIPDTDGYYQYERSKSHYPAQHFRLSARDMARFGQLYLNRGAWEGQQLIPASWIAASTKPYSITDTRYGIAYGMLWNVLLETENRKGGNFYHTGAGIHMLGIYPESNLVLVHRVDTEKDYHFQERDFYTMIRLVFAAKRE